MSNEKTSGAPEKDNLTAPIPPSIVQPQLLDVEPKPIWNDDNELIDPELKAYYEAERKKVLGIE